MVQRWIWSHQNKLCLNQFMLHYTCNDNVGSKPKTNSQKVSLCVSFISMLCSLIPVWIHTTNISAGVIQHKLQMETLAISLLSMNISSGLSSYIALVMTFWANTEHSIWFTNGWATPGVLDHMNIYIFLLHDSWWQYSWKPNGQYYYCIPLWSHYVLLH